MAEWKKVVVSGSSAELANLSVDSAVTASFFKGDGSALTNISIGALDGNISQSSQVFADVSGDISIASNGTAAIGSGVIVNDDINASAAIAHTKLDLAGSTLVSGSATQVRTFLNVENGADVTDSTNVEAAGALMDSEVTDLAGIKAVTISTLQPKPSEGAFADGDKTKLDGIEASADVTDTANVTAAGALMDSEVTSLSGVKSLVVPDSTTISTFGATLVDDADAAAARTTLGISDAVKTKMNSEGVISSSAQLADDFLDTFGDGVISSSAQVVLEDADKTGFTGASSITTLGTITSGKLSIGGGFSGATEAQTACSTILGGTSQLVNAKCSIVAGGHNNIIRGGEASSLGAGIFAGKNAIIQSGSYSAVIGGYGNKINDNTPNGIVADCSVVIGGQENCLIGSNHSAILGGSSNKVSGSLRSVVLGGNGNNTATFDDVFILGTGITATQDNTVFMNSASIAGTATANKFVGDGSGITNLSVSNLSGNISASAQVNADDIQNFDSNVKDKMNADGVISGSGQVALSGATGDTDDVTEGSTNLFYTDARVKTKLDAEGVVSASAQVFDDVTGEIAIASNGAATVADNVIDEANLKTSVAGTGLSGGNGSALAVDFGASSGQAAQGNTSVTFAGTANEIELTTNTFSTVGGGGNVTIGLPDNVQVQSDLTVGGNLNVTGDLTYVNSANLLVEDPFILLRSGSASEGDSGFIFGGSEGAAQSGSMLYWDASYNSGDGRLAVANSIAQDKTGNVSDSERSYYVAGVFEGSAGDAQTAEADHVGNIRVESSEIYIYV